MLVALFGQRRALHGVRRTLLCPAQPAVADGFLDRGKTLHLPDFQRPGQCRDRPHGGHGRQLLHTIDPQRISLPPRPPCTLPSPPTPPPPPPPRPPPTHPFR